MISNQRLRLLSYFVIAYMLIAFVWWSILLYTKNQDAFQAKAAYWKIILIAEKQVSNDAEFRQSEVFLNLERDYRRQEWMIFGEAAVFVISLVIGLYLINRAYHKEMTAAQQRRNFLLSITHELKSPLASIKLILETMMKRQLSEPQKEKLSRNALSETERLNTLVNDILMAARMETAYQLNTETLRVEELLEEILEKLRNKYPKATFHLQAPADLPDFSGDRLGLTSVALNLLENAIKYSPKPAKVSVKLDCDPDFFIWTISDQGIGIPDDEKKKVFDRFYRVGSEDTRKTKGTGLGLYIVKQVVLAHQGDIQVRDNQPQGSTFILKFSRKLDQNHPT